MNAFSFSRDLRRPLWLALLVISSVAFTLGFACATPFAAFAAAAACTLTRRDALYLTGAVWLANQAVGFLFLGYPGDANTLLWGAAIGATALLSLLAAFAARNAVVAFAFAFAVYEAALYAFSLALGGTENFTLAVQGRIFAIQAVTLLILLALQHLGEAAGLAEPAMAKA